MSELFSCLENEGVRKGLLVTAHRRGFSCVELGQDLYTKEDIWLSIHPRFGNVQVQAAFGIYSLIINKLRPLFDGKSSHIPPFLSAHPGVLGREIDPFSQDWENELWLRFHYILLSEDMDPKVREILDQDSISLDRMRFLTIPRYVRHERWVGRIYEIRMIHLLDELFKFKGQTLNRSLNGYWPEAREIEQICLHVRGLGAYAVQMYYRIPGDSSHWDYWIGSKRGEMFYDFTLRAFNQLDSMVG